ncbi:MAG TPA: pitrilysin family protein, partial [Chloroflexota bacterium]|nr:pitrilysin family protein [Chloroflexota bacterium]
LLNRGTSNELSQLTSTMPAAEVEVGFDLLADVVLHPLLDEGAIERQKQLALQELIRRRNEPGLAISDLFTSTFFAGHPLGSPLLGTEESIRALTRHDLLAHHDRFWKGSNLVLAVAGRITAAEATARAERFLGTLTSGTLNERRAVTPRHPASTKTVQAEAGQQQLQFWLGFPAPHLQHEDRHAVRVLNALMSGPAGRLFEELRNARGLAYVAGAAYSAYTDAGVWQAVAAVDPANLNAALDVVRAEIQRLRASPPPAEEVIRKINQLSGQEIIAAESNAARAAQLSAQEILGADSAEERVRGVRQVTPLAVWRVAQTYLDLNHSLLAIVRPPQR